MQINEIIQEIRDFVKNEGVSAYRLFDLAGIKCKTTAAHLLANPDWNPTAKTLAKLQDAIRVYRLGRE